MLTLGGEIQKIFYDFNLLRAKTIPHDIAAGSAGGTAITIRLSDLSTNVEIDAYYFNSIGNIAIKPSTAIIAIIATNFIPSS